MPVTSISLNKLSRVLISNLKTYSLLETLEEMGELRCLLFLLSSSDYLGWCLRGREKSLRCCWFITGVLAIILLFTWVILLAVR